MIQNLLGFKIIHKNARIKKYATYVGAFPRSVFVHLNLTACRSLLSPPACGSGEVMQPCSNPK